VVCKVCRAPHANFRCGACNATAYCGKLCQERHWEEHSASCRTGFFFFPQALSFVPMWAEHVKWTQHLLVAIVKKDAERTTREVNNILTNNVLWKRHLKEFGVSKDQIHVWLKSGPENNGAGTGVFLQHSLLAKAVFEGATGLDADNQVTFNASGTDAAGELFGSNLTQIVDFWWSLNRNSKLTRADVEKAWRTHLEVTVEYARQLLIAEGITTASSFVEATKYSRAQARLGGTVLEGLFVKKS